MELDRDSVGGPPSSRGVLVIGEALVDAITRDAQPAEVFPGGSPLNVAIGLQRLGLAARFHSRFGTDASGDLIAAHLAASGVELVPGARSSAPTSVAEAKVHADGSASYTFDVRWDLQPLPALPADLMAVHTGSIAAVLEPGASLVDIEIEALRGRATVSYDPNIRPQLMGEPVATRERVERMVARADVVKASDEDIHWLYPLADPARVARAWLDLGPSIVVITRGADGALAVTRAGTVEVAAQKAAVVDTVGAGDSFMSGLLAALADRALLGRESGHLLRSIDLDTTRAIVGFAALCAAVTVSRRGANPPARHDLGQRGSPQSPTASHMAQT
ncbi:MAG TPA: carbohydrate kinase [Microbacteriaceae bacterium]|nr:carbohydrate kinase [Microbacteriaceae bacterium]